MLTIEYTRKLVAPSLWVLVLCCVLLTISGLYALPAPTPSTKIVSILYEFPKPTVEAATVPQPDTACDSFPLDDEYVSVNMNGLIQRAEPGFPLLPSKTATILLPYETDMKDIKLTCGEKVQLSGSYIIEIGQKALPLSSDVPGVSLSADRKFYESSDSYPGKLYSNTRIQNKAGYRILLVDLHPVEYVPQTGLVSYYASMTMEVILEESEGNLVRGADCDRSSIEPMVDNPEALQTYPLSPAMPCEQEYVSMDSAYYEYVIITNEALEDTEGPSNFQALRDNKIERGIPATIVTTEWIYANYEGTRPDGGEDNQTRIRNFVTYAYENWGARYLLLGGDGDGGDVGGESGDIVIPYRGFYGDVNNGEYIDENILADMYYACLDGTFDYDSDGIYGEINDGPEGGEVDLLAEVYVGRACVDSETEVQNFVRKTLAYENLSSTDNNLRNVWMVGEQTGWGGEGEWGGNYKDDIKEGSNLYGYTTVGFEDSVYADDFDVSTLYDRDYEWPKSDIVALINNNSHLINHLGHASITNVMNMHNSDVDGLTNDELYFIGYSQGCYSGSFDNRSSTGTYLSYDCISEHLTTEAHGAVAFVANSRFGWGVGYSTDGPSQHFDREFWDAVLGESIPSLGIALQDSKEDNRNRVSPGAYGGDRWCYYSINLFGDPELRVKGLGGIKYECSAIDDSVGGDGDGYPEAGETIPLTVTLRNMSSSLDLTSVVATLSEGADPFITVTDNEDAYGDILAGGTATGISDYSFDIASDCPADHIVTFKLSITADNGGPWTSGFSITVVERHAISGHVRDLNTGNLISDAIVKYSGSMSGEVYTGADGSYEIIGLPQGSCSVYASAPSYSDCDVLQVTVPPDAAGVDLSLGRSGISVFPMGIDTWMQPDTTKEHTIMIYNDGNYKLTFDVTEDSASWLDVVPAEGIVPAGEMTELSANVDSSGLDPGEYDTELTIETNDPDASSVLIQLHLNVDNTAPEVRLTSPTGVETWLGGSPHAITWTAGDTSLGSGPITLEYYDGSAWVLLSIDEDNDGAYTWMVPTLNITTAKVRISVTDLAGNTAKDECENGFAIDSTSPQVNLISPNGGEYWAGGSHQTITWTASDTNLGGGPITLKYYDGSAWVLLSTDEDNDGAYTWIVPNLNITTAKVRIFVTDMAGNTAGDESENVFAFDSTAPPKPSSAKSDGANIDGVGITLDWSDSADFASVTYCLEVSTDKDFSTLLISEEGIVDSTYTVDSLPSEETYYWRVKSVDIAGNESQWGTIESFSTVTEAPLGPVVAVIAGGVMLLGLTFVVIRRRGTAVNH